MFNQNWHTTFFFFLFFVPLFVRVSLLGLFIAYFPRHLINFHAKPVKSGPAQHSTKSLINILFGAVKRHPKKEREKKKCKNRTNKNLFLPRPRRIINNNFGYLKYKYAQGSVTAEQGGREGCVPHDTHWAGGRGKSSLQFSEHENWKRDNEKLSL